MSSIIAIQQTDAIHLITDGAKYDHDSVVLNIASKVVHLRRSNCVFARRGAHWAVLPLEFCLRLFGSLDAIVEALPAILRRMLAEYDKVQAERAAEPHPIDQHFEITIAGWSDRMQRMVALVSSTWAVRDPHDQTGLSYQVGYVPCTPWLPAQGYSQPPVDWEGVLGRPFNTQAHVDAFDPVADGLALHGAQRLEGGTYLGKAAYLVGGFAELTTVRRDGVERQILCEWPDAIGKTITPAGAAPIDLLQAVLDADQALHAAEQQKADAVQAYWDARSSSELCLGQRRLPALDEAA